MSRRSPLPLLLAALALFPAISLADGYMEVWPFVLTDGAFHIHIPCPEAASPQISLRVQVSAAGQTVREATVPAQWENLAWPDAAWKAAGLPGDIAMRGAWVAKLPIGDLQPGTYDFTARIEAPEALAGRQFSATAVALHPRPDWLDAKAGIEGLKVVPRPWEPVGVEDGPTLTCWNRRTSLDAGDGLMQQITSGGERLLSGAVQLVLVDTQGVTLQAEGGWEQCESANTHASFRRTYTAEGSRAQITVTVEYDGFTWVSADIQSGPGIGTMELRVPMREPVAQYVYYFPDHPWFWGNIRNVIKAPRTGYGWTATHCDWLYVGDLSRGLMVYCPDRSRFDAPDASDTVRLVCQGDRMNLSVSVLRNVRPVQSGAFEFGLQATPVKPWPQDPLHNRVSMFNWSPGSVMSEYAGLGENFGGMTILDRMKQAGIRVVHLCEWWTTAWGGVEAREPEALKQLVAAAHERDMQVIVYFGFEIDDSMEAFQRFGREILGADPRLCSYSEYRFYGPARFDKSIPSRKTYGSDRSGPEMERILAGMERLLTEYDLDGFYLDGTQLPTGGVRKARELMKRMRYLCDTHSDHGIIYAHTSSRHDISVNGFADVVYNGEQFRSVKELQGRRSLAGVLPMDYILLLMNGTPWGVPHDLCDGNPEIEGLAQLLNVGARTYQWSESFWPLKKLWQEADLWRAAYTPPQDANPRWKGRPRDVYVSWYRSESAGWTVQLYNARAEEVAVEFPAREALGLSAGAPLGKPRMAFGPDGAETWAAEGDIWKGTLPSCRVVVLRASAK